MYYVQLYNSRGIMLINKLSLETHANNDQERHMQKINPTCWAGTCMHDWILSRVVGFHPSQLLRS